MTTNTVFGLKAAEMVVLSQQCLVISCRHGARVKMTGVAATDALVGCMSSVQFLGGACHLTSTQHPNSSTTSSIVTGTIRQLDCGDNPQDLVFFPLHAASTPLYYHLTEEHSSLARH